MKIDNAIVQTWTSNIIQIIDSGDSRDIGLAVEKYEIKYVIKFFAVPKRSNGLLRFVKEYGFNIEERLRDGNTILHYLINYINFFSYNETCEMRKVYNEEHFKVIEEIVKLTPDINEQNDNGETYLHVANKVKNREVVELLERNGARGDTKDILGNIPYDTWPQLRAQRSWEAFQQRVENIKMQKKTTTNTIEPYCEISQLFQNGPISLNKAKKFIKEAKIMYNTNLDNSYDSNIDTSKKFNEDKKRLFDEVIPLSLLAQYLWKINLKVDKIEFSSFDPSLGYDGRLQLNDNTMITIQLTRGVDGLNEALKQELLRKRGMAPVWQPINFTGNKHKRKFENNAPKVQSNLHLEKFPLSIKAAFNKKNNNHNCKEDWLIITVPFAGLRNEGFHEACNIAFSDISKGQNKFKRIIIINEDFYTHNISEEELLEYLWDSENEEHKVNYLLSLNDLKFDSDDGNLLISLLSKKIYLIKKNLDKVSKWLQDVSSKILEKDEGSFFKLYDLVANIGITLSTKKNYSVKACPINLAHNHHIGNLTCALLSRVECKGIITNDIKKRLIMFLSCPMIVFCLPVLIAKITFLHTLDSGWARKYLLHHFDWSSNHALMVWIIFAEICEFPREIGEESVEEILKNLPNAIKHIDLKTHKSSLENLCYLFARLSVSGHYSYDYSTKFLSELDITRLEFMSFGLVRQMDYMQENSSELWRNKIDPWLRNVWPKKTKKITKAISDNLIRAASYSKSAFGCAIQTLSELGINSPWREIEKAYYSCLPRP